MGFVYEKVEKSMGRDVHNNLLKRILLAPVNLFFDVTPIGKILNIFGDLHVVQGGMLGPPNGLCHMSSHVFMVSAILFSTNSWEVYFGFALMFIIASFLIKPYVAIDNQLHKIGSTLWGPIHSYFHESMRGTSIIRAYAQEETILAKQHQLLDKTTVHFIAHHSSWMWYNLRMYYTTKIIQVIAIVTIAKNRGTMDSLVLIALFNWTQDMGWMMHFFGCINHMMREAISAQRIFNLLEIPQEKIDGEIEKPKEWPSKGEIEFKDVELRYRPKTEVVLKKLSFKIKSGHKVGVVGRTGAGKSTLSMALTRIVELCGG